MPKRLRPDAETLKHLEKLEDSWGGPKPHTARHLVSFPHNGWRKIHAQMPPALRGGWQLLTWQARMLYRELCLHCNRDGVIELGSLGLRSVCGLLQAQGPEAWRQIEALLKELIATEWLVWFPEEPGQMAVAWFRASQETVRSPAAERQALLRSRRDTA